MTRKTVLVTGASRGIGAACARLLAERQYDVVINYLKNREAAEQVAASVRSAGAHAVLVQADVGVPADVARLFGAVDAELGGLDALVNNAGITGGFHRVDEVTPEMLTRVNAVNVVGLQLCCGEAVRRMSTLYGGAGGAIVNISSIAAFTGSPGDYVDYAGSKAAVNTVTIGLAREVAKEGIRVNAVAPGLAETDIHADGGRPQRLVELAPRIPLGRPGKPQEVAAAVAWLLGDEASYVTGSILNVAGGL